MLVEYLVWWYGEGWVNISQHIGKRVVAVWHLFSVQILLETLFSPWKRIVTPPSKSFDKILRGIVDNAVSRCVGFAVRSFVLISVAVFTSIASVFGLLAVAVWPLLPIAVGYCLVRSITS